MKKSKLIKENEKCPSCNSGMMSKIGSQLVCDNCALKANRINESEFYEVMDLSRYLLY